ncbi:OmpA family protein [Paraburkholderia kirstenboschensis]|uniref:OmpA-like domain-containing protein n=1 Tax=Paraburkholderia kirstenboschensis TaxID=1245436 RepID=A0ABZ0ENR1_9BURK|nr:hypothetical protein [Paraburkholderia kirstenboschensis]WOD18828.1 hypothetical protein RW095_39750 [Paraburkholderia kirstenboschensis]
MKRFIASSKVTFLALSILIAAIQASACTVSENMEDSLPLNSAEIPNSDRLRITEMVIAARQWPNVEIRGIIYAGGYAIERDPVALAGQRGSALRAYLIQLGIKESNIWMDTREIKRPDIDSRGNKALNQIAVTLVPICEGGCERLCSDPRVMPTTRAIQ